MVQEFTKSGFVDGVLELHKQLNSAFESAVSIASKTGIISADEAKNILERKRFQIFVNPNETQPENGFKGYFKFRNMICRFLEVIFDYALLFPVRDHGWSNANNYSKGITYNEIQELIRNRAPFTLQFMRIEEERPGSDEMLPDNINLFRVVLGKKSFFPERFDEVGNPYYDFPDIDQLDIVKFPDELNHEYTLVGKNFYAPLTTDNTCNCVLFAQLDNEYDDKAIKVLRWFPAKKGVKADQLLGIEPAGGDIFFELGHISRQENAELHSFMVEHNSRLLFGTKTGDKINIDGGIKIFQTNNLKYPVCLYKIKIG